MSATTPTPALPFTVSTYDPADFTAERRLGIGASDMPAVLGLSKYKTAADIYDEKRGESTRPEFTGNLRTMLGNALEDDVLDLAAERLGHHVQRGKGFAHTSRMLPWLRVHLDGYLRGDIDPVEAETPGEVPLFWKSFHISAVIDAKVTSNGDAFGDETEAGGAAFPIEYWVQLQTQMLATGAKTAHLAVLLIGQREPEFRLYTIHADAEIHEQIAEQGAWLWNLVQTGNPPPVDFAAPGALDVVKRRYPNATQEVFGGGEDFEGLLTLHKELGERIGQLKDDREAIEAQIRDAMGSASIATTPGGWRAKRSLIEIAEAVITRKASKYVRLTVTAPKPAKSSAGTAPA